MFNKGLDSSEKQEGLLKRLKNIEGKNEQQLHLIKDQGDRQLGLINKLNADKTKKIYFYNLKKSESRKLANKINRTIDEIKKIKNGKDEKTKFNYYCSDRKTVDYFENHTDLNEFGKDIKNGFISLNKAKEEQKKPQCSY